MDYLSIQEIFRTVRLKAQIALGLLLLCGPLRVQAEPLTMERAIELGLRADQPRLMAATARVDRSKGAVSESLVPWNPRLSLDASYTYTTPNASFSQFGQSIVFSQNHNYTAALRLTQLLWNGGFYASQEAARRCQVTLEQERLRERKLQIQEEVALVFVDLKAASETTAIAQGQLEQRKAHLRQAEILFKRGTVPHYDVTRAESELAQAELDLVDTSRQERQLKSQLSSLLNQPVGELASLGEPTNLTLGNSTDGRPDVKLAHLALQEGAARLAAAEAENAPSLSFQTDFQQRNATAAVPGSQWNTGLVFSWPLFDQGQSAARAAQVKAEVGELTAQALEVERVARLELEQVELEMQSRFVSWQTAQRRLVTAEEGDRVSRIRYENGLSNQVERLDAQVTLLKARKDVTVARYVLARSQVRYRRALGMDQFSIPNLKDSSPEGPQSGGSENV